MRRFVLGLFFGLLLGVVAAVGVRQYLRAKEPKPQSVLTINGQDIPLEAIKAEALMVNGNAVLNSMIQRTLIEQEAARQKLQLSPEDEEQLKKVKPGPNAQTAREQVKAALFAQKMLLKGVSEAQIKETYELYKSELTEYELFAIVLVTRKAGQELQKSLENGSSFDTLVTNFSIDPSRAQGGRLGLMTMPQIRRSLGQDAADEVARLKPNQVGKVIYTPFGLTVLKLGKVQTEYKELKPLVTALIAESHRANLMYRLYSSAKIQSPLLGQAPDPLPKDVSGIKPEKHDLPVPDSSGPGAQDLPAPETDK